MNDVASGAGTNEEASIVKSEEGKICIAVRHRGWKFMPLIIGNETFEMLGSIGTACNLMVYLTSVIHLSNVHAATMLNVFNGTTNLAIVVGAYVLDSYLGRCTTVGLGTLASLSVNDIVL